MNALRFRPARSTRLSRIASSLAIGAAVALGGLAGCVEDVGLVNRQTEDQIPKTLFEGQWYYWQTVTDAPYSTAVAFTGMTNFGGDAKVVFEISEDFLIAYPTTAKVDGTEEEFRLRKIRKYWDPEHRDEFVEMYVGQPIAVWPIEHFDVIRDYNTYNGAQSNQVVENKTDRPWYERDYLRVKWESQEITQFFFDLYGGIAGDTYYAGQDKAGQPDELTIDVEGGYFDYVLRTKVGSVGQFRCSIFGLSPYDCAESIVKVRHSFRRADPARDYEPIRYHNMEQQEKFGFFLTERPHYDEDYGPSYAGSISWANRWNLWRNNFDYEFAVGDDGAEIECFKDIDCDRDAGQRCQKDGSAFSMGRCAVAKPRAYKDRTKNPIIYHLNADWHPDYVPEAYATAEGWNDVFKEAVSWQLFYEEKGQYDVRGCTTHDECATPDLLLDLDVTVDYPAFPCHTQADCGATESEGLDGSVCGSTGFCATTKACGPLDLDQDGEVEPNEKVGCGSGQTCQGGICVVVANGTATPVEQNVTQVLGTDVLQTRGSTVVFFGDGHILTYDNFSTHVLQEMLAGGVYVRFVHADPDGGDLGLSVGGVELAGGAFDASRDYDPQDPATAPFLATAPAGADVPITVRSGGSVIAEIAQDLEPNKSYLVVWDGKKVIVHGETFNASRKGIRFIHAAAGEKKLDFAVNGVRLAKAVSYRGTTPYENLAGTTQRVTLTRAGTRGDLTCYTTDTIGRCVGWGMDLTIGDLERRVEIKSELPDLFVLCENKYVATAAEDQANVDAARKTKGTILGEPCRAFPYDEGQDENAPGALSTQCPDGSACPSTGFCETDIDAAGFYGNAWYTRTVGGEPYNPCGDPLLVPHPTEMKKVGDIRYSFFYWVTEMMRAGPLGYGPSYADPETGQVITGTANIYGAALQTYGQFAADLIALVNGDLTSGDVITGKWVQDYLATKGLDADDPQPEKVFDLPVQGAEFAGQVPDLYGDGEVVSDEDVGVEEPAVTEGLEPNLLGNAHALELEAPLAGFFGPGELRAGKGILTGKLVPDHAYPELMEMMRHPELLQAELQQTLPVVDPAMYHQRLQKVKGTWIEDLLLNNEIMAAAPGVDPEGLLSKQELHDKLSPVAWASKYALQTEEERIHWFAKQNMYMAEFVDDSIWGLAKELSEGKELSGDALRREVSRRVLRGVLEHEVGHTIGLRHNFSASSDTFNFFDQYYRIREKEVILCQDSTWCDDLSGQQCVFQSCQSDSDCLTGLVCQGGSCSAPDGSGGAGFVATGACAVGVEGSTCTSSSQCGEGQLCQTGVCYDPLEQFVPRTWLTDNEKSKKRTEYQYSSVMDYGGRFNSDVHGLGKYDYAAIKFGYSQLVDTYVDRSLCDQRIQDAAVNYGGQAKDYSWFCNPQFWPNRGTGFFHVFNYLTNYIGVDQNLLRVPRPYEQVKYQRDMVVNDDREYIDLEYLEVPYAFCSDEYRGNMGCYYFDMGIDMGEMARHATDQLEQYYLFDAFKRERLYFGQWGSGMAYFSRIMDRYLRVLGDVGMYYAFYKTFLFRYGWFQSWLDNPLGGRTMDLAAKEAFGDLLDTVSSPAPGSYVLDDDKGAYVNISLETGEEGSELDIPFGVGRFPYTQFGYQLGYNYWEHPLWFGSFWEKIGALLTLTDSTAYFVDQFVGEQLNIGVGTSLGFNTVFAQEMNSFLGGIISDEMPRYSGRYIQGKYAPPSIAMRDTTGVAVEPSLNTFTLKLYSALFGLAYLPAGFDPQFIDATAVFLEGDPYYYEHASIPGVFEHRFEDPIAGTVYVAFDNNYGQFGQNSISAGATLIDRAQDYAEQWAEAEGAERLELEGKMAEVREILDVLRGLNQVYGASTLGL